MSAAEKVLDLALQAHGGIERWKKIPRIDLTWSFRGMMFKMRFRERQLRHMGARIWTQEPRVEIASYIEKDSTCLFTPTRLTISRANGSTSFRDDPRATFGGLRTLLWWDDFQMLYFAGYVLWNYSQLPFLLTRPGIEIGECAPHDENGHEWSRISAVFPADMPSHCREQRFFFDEEGLLRRHDYYVAVMGSVARGARYIHSYVDVDGFKLPSRIEIKLRGAGEGFLKRPPLGLVDLDNTTLAGPSSREVKGSSRSVAENRRVAL